MCGLAINIAGFAHLLRKVDFDAVVDHLAITPIMRSKVEPATNRIKRIIGSIKCLFFSFVLDKGKGYDIKQFPF